MDCWGWTACQPSILSEFHDSKRTVSKKDGPMLRDDTQGCILASTLHMNHLPHRHVHTHRHVYTHTVLSWINFDGTQIYGLWFPF